MFDNSTLIIVALVVFLLIPSSAFQHNVIPGRFRWRQSTRTRTLPRTISTARFHQGNANGDFSNAESSPLVIAVIGPLLNTPPLLIGASLWLDPPTPLQWKTIEICVDTLKKRNNSGNFATIDSAPLVAILQEGSQLAAITAIVGWQKATDDDALRLDTFDSASLRESLSELSTTTPFYKESAKVRLLCIGRAKLSNFRTHIFKNDETNDEVSIIDSTQPPTDDNDPQKLSKNLQVFEKKQPSTDEAVSQIDGWDTQYKLTRNEVKPESSSDPVLIACMKLIIDTSTTREYKNDDFGSHSSPVHALSKLSMLKSRIGFLHSDRQKLVQGIQAVQMRLEMKSQEWQDWDGIGTLYDDTKGRNSAVDPNDNTFQSAINEMLRLSEPQPTAGVVPSFTNAKALPPRAARLLDLDNFGLGSTSSAYSDLNALTNVLMELLHPYYSPERLQTEEFEYSLYSWAALQSILEYLKGTNEMHTLLTASNTMDRMDLVYHTMMSHKEALKELAVAKSQELRDCGEECNLF